MKYDRAHNTSTIEYSQTPSTQNIRLYLPFWYTSSLLIASLTHLQAYMYTDTPTAIEIWGNLIPQKSTPYFHLFAKVHPPELSDLNSILES